MPCFSATVNTNLVKLEIFTIMELFQRIKKATKAMTLSDSAMAAALGMKQSTFSGYLNQKRQHNLWPLLPQILKAFPQISRQWLYFEEGPMVIGRGIPEGLPVPPLEIMRVAEAMAADCHGSWGQVLRMIVDNARVELETNESTNEIKMAPETQKELAEAKGEIIRLQKELLGLQGEIISLQKELLAIHKAEKPQANECPGRAADTGQTVARS